MKTIYPLYLTIFGEKRVISFIKIDLLSPSAIDENNNMISNISNAKNYEWVLTCNGVPDMRLRQNRENVLEMAKELDKALATEKSKRKRFLNKTQETTCSICMEEMEGRVTMKCGHEMCPECFANHARVNHTCPFCRDEFAKKNEVREKIPAESISAIVEEMYDPETTNTPENYFARAANLIQNTDAVEATHYIEYLIKMNSTIAGGRVADWYDA